MKTLLAASVLCGLIVLGAWCWRCSTPAPRTTASATAPCPKCSGPLNLSRQLEGPATTPEPGDWLVCGHCASPLVLDTTLRPASPASPIPSIVIHQAAAVQEKLRAARLAGR